MKLRVVETIPLLQFAGPGKKELIMASGFGKVRPKTLEEWEEGATGPLLKGLGNWWL
jgi:hypothetical protein